MKAKTVAALILCILFSTSAFGTSAVNNDGKFVIIVERISCANSTSFNFRVKLNEADAKILEEILEKLEGVENVSSTRYSVNIARGSAFLQDEIEEAVLVEIWKFFKTTDNKHVIFKTNETDRFEKALRSTLKYK